GYRDAGRSMGEGRKVLPEIWEGETGMDLRSLGPEVQLIALYLMTAPRSHQSGLYKLSMVTMAEHTGMQQNFQRAEENLRKLIEAGFAQYDVKQQIVYIPNMARYQIGTE